MRFHWPHKYFFVVVLVISSLFAFCLLSAQDVQPSQVNNAVKAPGTDGLPQTPEDKEVVGQMVRLSHVQGDVRLSREVWNRDDYNKGWETAFPNTVVEEGFALATGRDGRAEVEFETGSVGYLAENSLLLFDTLETANGVPATVLRLVTGTASFAVSTIKDERFMLVSSGNSASVPSGVFFRADSYLDGFILTPVRESGGGIIVYPDRKFAKLQGVKPPSTHAGWNEWILDRQQAREAALPSAMKAARVATPFPGLLDLYAQGTFFDCAPYGECWAPLKERDFSVTDCFSGYRESHETTFKDVRTGKKKNIRELLYTSGPWLACNYGEWMYYDTGYAWTFDNWMLPGNSHHHRRHHGCDGDRDHGRGRGHGRDRDPGRAHGGPHYPPRNPKHEPGYWVKVNGKTGFVPRHPDDVEGKPPVNLKHGLFLAKKGGPIEHVPVKVGDAGRVRILDGAPRHERRIEAAAQHRAADPPKIVATMLADATPRAGGVVTSVYSPRQFEYDYHSKKFVDHVDVSGVRHERPVGFVVDREGNVVSTSRAVGAFGPGVASHTPRVDSGNIGSNTFSNNNGVRPTRVDYGSRHDRADSNSVYGGRRQTGSTSTYSGSNHSSVANHSGGSSSASSGYNQSGSGGSSRSSAGGYSHSGGSSSSSSGGGYSHSGGSASSGSSHSSGSSSGGGNSGGHSGGYSGGGYSGGASSSGSSSSGSYSGGSSSSSSSGSSGSSGGGHASGGGHRTN